MDVQGTDRVHVEHIYPQTPAAGRWPNHAAMVNRLGNHTLLSKRLNISIKNADFTTKKANAYSKSDVLMTKELCEMDAWDADAVVERQEELSTWIMGIWGFSGEAVPAPASPGSVPRTSAASWPAAATTSTNASDGTAPATAAPPADESVEDAEQLPEVPLE